MGIDLAPIDTADAEEVRWLEALVWPGQPDRLARLREAITVAQEDPPPVVRGDLLDDLAAVAARAPSGTTLVVFHTATLAYLEPDRRERFADAVREIGAHWIANEGFGVTPGLSATPDATLPPPGSAFVVSENSTPVALADPHGAWIHWLAP